MVILLPMLQLGCFRAWAAVTCAQPLRVPGAKRPAGCGKPELPDILRALSVQGLKNSAVFAVHRDDGYASSRTAAITREPAATRVSLLARATGSAGPDRGRGGRQAHRPDHGGDHQVGPGRHRHLPDSGRSPENFGGRPEGKSSRKVAATASSCTDTRAGPN